MSTLADIKADAKARLTEAAFAATETRYSQYFVNVEQLSHSRRAIDPRVIKSFPSIQALVDAENAAETREERNAVDVLIWQAAETESVAECARRGIPTEAA